MSCMTTLAFTLCLLTKWPRVPFQSNMTFLFVQQISNIGDALEFETLSFIHNST